MAGPDDVASLAGADMMNVASGSVGGASSAGACRPSPPSLGSSDADTGTAAIAVPVKANGSTLGLVGGVHTGGSDDAWARADTTYAGPLQTPAR